MLFRSMVLLACATGCADLPTASELGEPQILALVAEPPCIEPGASARLDAIVAGPDGTIAPLGVAWSVPAGSAGTIEGSSVRAAVDAPAKTLIEVAVAVDAGGVMLHGFRTLTVGTCANPSLAGIAIDDVSLPVSSELAMISNSRVELDVVMDGEPATEPIVSWFTTAGTIELYRHTPTELVVRDPPGPGALYVVYRDGHGGVAWLAYDALITSR